MAPGAPRRFEGAACDLPARSIDKQDVLAGLERWSRSASRGPQESLGDGRASPHCPSDRLAGSFFLRAFFGVDLREGRSSAAPTLFQRAWAVQEAEFFCAGYIIEWFPSDISTGP